MRVKKTKSLGATSVLMIAFGWQLAAPCLAQSSPFSDQAPVPMPSALRWYKIPLQYAKSADLTKLERWDSSNSDPKFPRGVTDIAPLLDENALEVQATPLGFENAQDILHDLDHRPCLVQVKLDFVIAGKADEAGTRHQTSMTTGSLVSPSKVVPINEDATSQYFAPLSRLSDTLPAPVSGRFIVNTVSMSQTPVKIVINKQGFGAALIGQTIRVTLGVRVNSDDTIMLVLLPYNLTDKPRPNLAPTESTLTTAHVTRNNQKTVVGYVPNYHTPTLVFATPTLLPESPTDSTTIGPSSEGASQ